MEKSILVAEDNAELLNLICDYLGSNGWKTTAVTTLDQAISTLEEAPTTVVLTDFHLAEGSGRQLCKWIKKKFPDLPVYLMTGTPYVTENDFNIYQFKKVFLKPLRLSELLAEISKV